MVITLNQDERPYITKAVPVNSLAHGYLMNPNITETELFLIETEIKGRLKRELKDPVCSPEWAKNNARIEVHLKALKCLHAAFIRAKTGGVGPIQ